MYTKKKIYLYTLVAASAAFGLILAAINKMQSLTAALFFTFFLNSKEIAIKVVNK